MNQNELKEMFKTAEKLYWEMNKKRGFPSPIPYAYAKNEKTGTLIIVSQFDVKLKEILDRLHNMM